MQEQANAIWETTEEGELGNGLAGNVDFGGRQQRTQNKPAAKGRIIGKVQGNGGNPLERPSMVAELPFSRAASDRSLAVCGRL